MATHWANAKEIYFLKLKTFVGVNYDYSGAGDGIRIPDFGASTLMLVRESSRFRLLTLLIRNICSNRHSLGTNVRVWIA